MRCSRCGEATANFAREQSFAPPEVRACVDCTTLLQARGTVAAAPLMSAAATTPVVPIPRARTARSSSNMSGAPLSAGAATTRPAATLATPAAVGHSRIRAQDAELQRDMHGIGADELTDVRGDEDCTVAEQAAFRGALSRPGPSPLDIHEALRDCSLEIFDDTLPAASAKPRVNDVLRATRKCNFTNRIVAHISGRTSANDVIPWRLLDANTNAGVATRWWCVVDACDWSDASAATLSNAAVPSEGMERTVSLGFTNFILAIDLCAAGYSSANDAVEIILRATNWLDQELHAKGTALGFVAVLLRDFSLFELRQGWAGFARAQRLVKAVAADQRCYAVLCDEATGMLAPETVAKLVAGLREAMEAGGTNGDRRALSATRSPPLMMPHLVIRVRRGLGFEYAAVLAALVRGASGLWGSVCEATGTDGLGAACSATTVAALCRYGNTKAAALHHPAALRHAARKVHELITTSPVGPTQEVYGTSMVAAGSPTGGATLRAVTAALARRCWLDVPPPAHVSDVPSVAAAMRAFFGDPRSGGWQETKCAEMTALFDRLAATADLPSTRSWDRERPQDLMGVYERCGGVLTTALLGRLFTADPRAAADAPADHPLIELLRQRWAELCEWAQPTLQRPATPGTATMPSLIQKSKFAGLSDDDGRLGSLPLPLLQTAATVSAPASAPMNRASPSVGRITSTAPQTPTIVSWRSLLLRLRWCLLQASTPYRTPDGLAADALAAIAKQVMHDVLLARQDVNLQPRATPLARR
jgi:hypothetical protein